MDAKASLYEAIRTVPIPAAPPRLSDDGAGIGLAFLDTVLRQNHVRRLTERISVVEHGAARRTTEVDVNLRMLDRGQLAAAKTLRQGLRRSIPVETPREGAARPGATAWVPVATIPHRSVSPVPVENSVGERLQTLTQYESSRLLASGLYRLLRGILTSHSDGQSDTALGRLLHRVHESRWLIQAAMLALMTERSKPHEAYAHPRTVGTVGGSGAQYRRIALATLQKYEGTLGKYFELLDIALNDYLLVVALDSDKDDHLLRYDSPLDADTGQLGTALSGCARLLAGQGYQVEYRSSIPSNIRSYHLVFETTPGLEIEAMYLSTDTDQTAVDGLVRDLRALAHHLEAENGMPTGRSARKLGELEVQKALQGVAELLRRRRWEADQAAARLAEESIPACTALAWAAVSGEAVTAPATGVRNSLLQHPSVTPERLNAAADELASRDLGWDLSVENDATTSRAHTYWRRSGQRCAEPAAQTNIRSAFVIRDTTPGGRRGVLTYALAVAAISYLMACLLSKSFWGFGLVGADLPAKTADAGAVIAVLLLVPGFLYARLALPERTTIAGRLRALSRSAAHASVAAAAALAATVAANPPAPVMQLAFALGVAVPLAVAAILAGQEMIASRGASVRALNAPCWVAGTSHPAVRRFRPDVRYYSSGVQQ